MSYVISIHSERGFQEFLLPAINNSEYNLNLKKDVFALNEDIELKLEVINSDWKILSSDKYELLDTNTKEKFEKEIINDKDMLTLVTASDKLSLIISRKKEIFISFEKYNISKVKEITIGKNPDNTITYDYMLVSRVHAVIKKVSNQCIIEDTSKNGVFVNSKRVVGSYELHFGDNINIFGLNIIYLGQVIAVNTHTEGVAVNEAALSQYIPAEEKEDLVSLVEKKIFHRSPRAIFKLEVDEVEIEPPPAPKEKERKPLGMIIGPTLTMSLPMLMGCALSIYSTKISGRSSSAFMYTGLVTAIGSATLGTIWTLINLRYDKKKTIEDENLRLNAYGEYLIKRSDEIKDMYVTNTNNLNQTYISAEECCEFNENNILLWNRNTRHEDFLTHRLGLGDLPFQADIIIPKEKFTLINDSLAEKPALIKENFETLHNVPVGVDMLEHRMLGIIGGEGKHGAIEIMHTLVAQIATSNCYTDVKMAFIQDETDDEKDWAYLKWLPHTWSQDKKTRYVGKTKEEISEILYEIIGKVRIRKENRNSTKEKLELPQYILFISNPALLEGELINSYIEDENNQDLIVVFLVDSYENLPNGCTYVIENDEAFNGIYDIDADEKHEIIFDKVSNTKLEKLSRTLANIEVKEMSTGGDIPTSLTFFDMFRVKNLKELNVLEKWRKNRTYETMKAVIGQKAGGQDWYLDIHEKYHGPHGLVAGTTGSGKSETLQTYILSLAINYSPDDVGFFLIDYKGGGMANLFDGLPHILGQISNLSGNQVRRAMVSIKSENKRRQRIFNENGVNNINLYTKLYKNNEATIPVPHLFIVIDEFAELKREEPEFMKELISVAQVGRSLGVHLILATQKPSGTVDDNIWSNSKFRLCLRVQDKQDSNDMLHRPDAAYITQAGRGYMQVGNDELFELFQSGFSGAEYDEEETVQKADIAKMLSRDGKAALVGNRLKIKQKEMKKVSWILTLLKVILENNSVFEIKNFDKASADSKKFVDKIFIDLQNAKVDYQDNDFNRARMEDFIKLTAGVCDSDVINEETARQILVLSEVTHTKLPEKKQKTQLDAVVEYLAKVAKENGYEHDMQLWLPVLPTWLTLQELLKDEKRKYFDGENWDEIPKEWNISVPIGMFDDPVNQRQDVYDINFSLNGHHAIVGTIVSGKSTFLQTLVYGLVNKYTPQEINIYAIDYSAKMMTAFENMPHVGGVILEGDDEKLAKCINMLSNMMAERKKLLKGGNYSQYVRSYGLKLPTVILAIDNYANFRAKTNGKYDDFMLNLCKEGVSNGMYIVITGGGFGMSEIPNKLGDNIRTVVCLELADKYAYGDAMKTMHLDTIPESNIKGRGLAKVGEQFLEFQTAIAFDETDDFLRMEKIEKLSNVMREKWTGKFARRIPQIPEKPLWSDFIKQDDTSDLFNETYYLPIGYNYQNAAPYGIDLSRNFCYLVGGKPRTGKSNFLRIIVDAARIKDAEIYIFDFDKDFDKAKLPEKAEYIDDDKKVYDFFSGLIPDFKERNAKKRQAEKDGLTDREIFDVMMPFKKKILVITSLPSFIHHVMHPENAGDVSAFVKNILEKGARHNVYLFAAFNYEEISKVAGLDLYKAFINYKTGIHFGGNVDAQRILNFDYIPFAEKSKVLKPGDALLPLNDEEDARHIIVPLMKG